MLQATRAFQARLSLRFNTVQTHPLALLQYLLSPSPQLFPQARTELSTPAPNAPAVLSPPVFKNPHPVQCLRDPLLLSYSFCRPELSVLKLT